MSFRLVLFLILILITAACAPVAPDGTLQPGSPPAGLPGTAIVSDDLTDTLPKTTKTYTPEQPDGTSIISETVEAINAAQLFPSPRFNMQTGSPVALANFVAPEVGCNWLGVGGQAFDLQGKPYTNLVVEVGGRLEDKDIFHLALTGSSTVLGPGGFVITLADHGINSSNALWIILYDLAGTALTGKIYFSTSADCTKNFILINFSERSTQGDYQLLLPWIRK